MKWYTVGWNKNCKFASRLAIDWSICILTRPVVNTGFNWSLLVDWWSIGRLKKTWSMGNLEALMIPFYWTL